MGHFWDTLTAVYHNVYVGSITQRPAMQDKEAKAKSVTFPIHMSGQNIECNSEVVK